MCWWCLVRVTAGNGVEQLRDHNIETYWQSDGTQPHSITIQFLRKVTLSEVCLYLDFNLDESYAPKKICVSLHHCYHCYHYRADTTQVYTYLPPPPSPHDVLPSPSTLCLTGARRLH